MVRVIAEISVHSPTAFSNERYKYQHGYQKNEHALLKEQQNVYKRPVLTGGGSCCGGGDSSGMPKKPLCDTVGDAVGDYIIGCISNIAEKNEREQREQREKEQEEELRRQERRIREREQEERRRKEINPKLGEIIYKTRAGGVFRAHHSVHMTVTSTYDRKMGQMVQTYTEKIIWNGITFDNKQSWFSEMNRQCVPIADEDMKIARCE
jgi:hypothetical protein